MKDSIKQFFRLGLIAKGVVYIIIGGLAIFASQSPSSRDAIQFIAEQPFGRILLILTSLGLLFYSIWRWYRAVETPQAVEQEDPKENVKRVGYAISGTLYGTLAVYAFFLISTTTAGAGGSTKQDILQSLLSESWGQWLVGIGGAIVIGVGFYHLYKVIKEKYWQDIKTHELSPRERRILDISAKTGLLARAVVFGVIGYFLIRAAIRSGGTSNLNTGQVFEFLQSSGFPLAAVLLAIGLALYGVYMFIKARYRTI